MLAQFLRARPGVQAGGSEGGANLEPVGGADIAQETRPHMYSETDAVELDALLLDVIRGAQRVWPMVALPTEVFVTYLGERIPPGVPDHLALRQMHTADLYLACACARGDVRAFAAFDDRCLRRLDRVLAKVGIDAITSREIEQDIRSRVLVGDGRPAQIVDYSGRGDLRGWVRVMAVRQVLQRRRRTRREVVVENDELLQRIVTPGNPELDYLKRIYRQEFTRAFEAALRALPAREQTVLRQHHVDGLSVDDLGRLYRMHRSTAARLVIRARMLVLEATRARMMSELGVQPQDLDSIIRMIRSQIEISLRALQRSRKR